MMCVPNCLIAQEMEMEETKVLGNNRIAYRQGDLWGLADMQGNILTQPLWSYVEEQNMESPIQDPIVVSMMNKEEERQGLIDIYGNEILPAEWGRLERLDSGVCIAWRDDLFQGYCCTLSPKGELIETLPENTWTEALYVGAAYNVLYGYLPDGRYGWFALGEDGRIALMCAEDDWKAKAQGIVYEDGYAYVSREEQVGFMAMDGNVLTDESWRAFELYNSDYGIVRADDGLVCVGLRGQKTLVFPMEYSAGRPIFSNGKWYIPLAVYDQGLQKLLKGWVNEEGKIVRDFE